MERIKAVSSENKDLNARVQGLQDKLMEVSIALAASQEKIKHLEAEINLHQMKEKAKSI